MLDEKWGAISLQVSIIATGSYLVYYQKISNSFILMSITLILSLFCLQVISRRFLLFYPTQGLLKVPTKMVDTFLLRTFVILSVFFLLLGGTAESSTMLQAIEINLRAWCWVLIPFLIFILPMIWHFIFDEKIRTALVDELRKKEYRTSLTCPKCGVLSSQIIRVLSQNSVEYTVDCECGTWKYLSSINIGY